MNRSKTRIIYSAISFLLMLGVFAQAQQKPSAKREASKDESKSGASGNVARGKYLATGVAMCTQCHSPRDYRGNADTNRPLEGAPLWLLPAYPTPNWPVQAPRIAGSPSASDAEMITLLTTGVWKTGAPLRPPMPQFRMSTEDAAAVVAYLRSLNPGTAVE